MKIHHETIKEFGTLLIRLGEAAIIGGVATWFVKGFNHWISSVSIGGGVAQVFLGLLFINKSNFKKEKEQEKEKDEHEQHATRGWICHRSSGDLPVYPNWKYNHQSLVETAEKIKCLHRLNLEFSSLWPRFCSLHLSA